MSTESPPNDERAERELMGCLLLEPELLTDVSPIVRSGAAFYTLWIGEAFDAILALEAQGEDWGPSTVAREAKLDEQRAYDLVALASETPTSAGVLHAAKTVAGHYKRRQLCSAASEIISRARRMMTPADEVADFAAGIMAAISAEDLAETTVSLSEALDEWLTKRRVEITSGTPRGMSTGIDGLDQLIGGLRPGRLHVLAAKPGVGKTALAINIGMALGKASREAGAAGPHIFSLEMDKLELAERIVAQEIGIKREDEILLDSFGASVADIAERTGMLIDDTAGLSLQNLVRRAKRMHEREATTALIVDYIGLVRSTNKHDREDQEIGEVVRALKNLARWLRVPVIALSQMNRNIDKRTDKTPLMSDLKGASDIEQEADQIWFLTRDDDTARIIIAKNRAGPVGEAHVRYDKERTKFYEHQEWR